MTGELPSDGGSNPRSALGDVTNRVGKRGFCFNFSLDVNSAKKECRRLDEFKENVNNNNNKEGNECVLRPHSSCEIGLLKENVIDGIPKIACEVKESCPPSVRRNAASALSAADVASEGCRDTEPVQVITLDENGVDGVVEVEDDERTESADGPGIGLKGGEENDLGVDDGNDVSVDNLGLSKDEYFDCSRLLESQESKCGLEPCVGQTGDGFSGACVDMIKDCSCSFCKKAAQLWSDLHYEDIKGRIAAIKKSQKEASILVNRNSRDVASNFGKLSNLESDLTGRWKSLFLHMEDIFVREGTQLETSLSTLKEVTDDCKTDLEKN
ncbi:hypothetical protein M8C21_023853 [Ambrosia artemisiifolia]|uniref:Uncharacterized protein n=1 Tax=Ambrosia artemisiifolia TaxID=4212 RepID=A0AAD5CFT5_AMBAR|nr:hypothetical protein M8C21_023853 [Ambrosia artemisiifolia]